jgi:hypothetical protein
MWGLQPTERDRVPATACPGHPEIKWLQMADGGLLAWRAVFPYVPVKGYRELPGTRLTLQETRWPWFLPGNSLMALR